MIGAGRSAQAEYERRRAKDAGRRRAKLPRTLVVVPLGGVITYFLVRNGVPWALQNLVADLVEILTGAADPAQPVITPEQAHPFALLFAVLASLCLARIAWGRRATTEAWAKGAAGERRTATALQGLEREGFRVLHDLRMPGRRANIDHVVVGPTGVFTVESKYYKGKVVVGRRSVLHNGRRRDDLIEQARDQAHAVGPVLGAGAEVQPVLCFHGVEFRTRGFAGPVVGGVLVCTGRNLAKRLRKRPGVLDVGAVEDFTRRLEGGLQTMGAAARAPGPAKATTTPSPPVRAAQAPMAAPQPAAPSPGQCSCGGDFVLRRRRADGAPFWGCSNFPRCRQTRAVGA